MAAQVAQAHVQRLVSVVKMATVPEECTIEQQRFGGRFFLWAKDSMQRIFIKKYFLLKVGSVTSICLVH
jgi:hypothetical protein